MHGCFIELYTIVILLVFRTEVVPACVYMAPIIISIFFVLQCMVQLLQDRPTHWLPGLVCQLSTLHICTWEISDPFPVSLMHVASISECICDTGDM